MIGLSVGIALMGAIVSARWPGGLAGAAVDPRTFVDGLSVAFVVNAAVAVVAALLAALTFDSGPERRALRLHRSNRPSSRPLQIGGGH